MQIHRPQSLRDVLVISFVKCELSQMWCVSDFAQNCEYACAKPGTKHRQPCEKYGSAALCTGNDAGFGCRFSSRVIRVNVDVLNRQIRSPEAATAAPHTEVHPD